MTALLNLPESQTACWQPAHSLLLHLVDCWTRAEHVGRCPTCKAQKKRSPDSPKL